HAAGQGGGRSQRVRGGGVAGERGEVEHGERHVDHIRGNRPRPRFCSRAGREVGCSLTAGMRWLAVAGPVDQRLTSARSRITGGHMSVRRAAVALLVPLVAAGLATTPAAAAPDRGAQPLHSLRGPVTDENFYF